MDRKREGEPVFGRSKKIRNVQKAAEESKPKSLYIVMHKKGIEHPAWELTVLGRADVLMKNVKLATHENPELVHVRVDYHDDHMSSIIREHEEWTGEAITHYTNDRPKKVKFNLNWEPTQVTDKPDSEPASP
eukprot:335694-Hanusia_phi.AAC.9